MAEKEKKTTLAEEMISIHQGRAPATKSLLAAPAQ